MPHSQAQIEIEGDKKVETLIMRTSVLIRPNHLIIRTKAPMASETSLKTIEETLISKI